MAAYYRNEIKYICSQQQLVLLKQRILGSGCKMDSHADENGVYIIRSVYFDDPDNMCYWDNVNGCNPREKYRVRIYNGESSIIKLECKQKNGSKIHKESCVITEEECRSFIKGKIPYRENPHPVYQKFGYAVSGRGFRPKVIVEYERTAFVYPLGNVRITFDRYIASSTQFEHFFEEDMKKRPVMPLHKHILEVKYDELLPDYIYNSLQMEGLQRTAYSKYNICRDFCM